MRHKFTALAFLAVLFGIFVLSLVKAPDEFSASERRRLSQFPALTGASLLDGSFMRDFEGYAVDQAPFRESWRRCKAVFDMGILRRLDNNGVFISDGMAYKIDYPLNEASVQRLCGIINTLRERYLEGAGSVWYTVVPDKNAYLRDSGRLVMDYAEIESLVRDALGGEITCIDIGGDLSRESYYLTDPHWRQEELFPVARRLAGAMNFPPPDPDAYREERFDAYYGAYYGQSALNIEPDEMVWLVSQATARATVTSAEQPGRVFPVYDKSQLTSVDPYSLYLCGPAAIVRAVRAAPAATGQATGQESGRRLIILRDSFASALAPLLMDGFDEIVLIDLRYVSPDTLAGAVDFDGADVLFLYSAGFYNNCESVRGFAGSP
ncbi:MAG: hypothetical protein FWE59_06095 [Oscillospiraceae bacterium]|nr:hypothetical protein [Oscillospiraceae bacterium]